MPFSLNQFTMIMIVIVNRFNTLLIRVAYLKNLIILLFKI